MTPTYPTDDPRWDRLIHLVAGELPPEEAAALLRWVEADPARREALAELEQVWGATDPAVGVESAADLPDAEVELRRIKAEAGGEGRVIARVGPKHLAPKLEPMAGEGRRVGAALRVAAMLAIVAGGLAVWRLQGRAPAVVPPAAVAMAEYRTAPGERLSLRLPDGTKVMLGPGGVLRRAPTYGTRDRAVELEGEAYFVVTHDSTRPFSVRSKRAVARDLGTRFVVRAYPADPATEVVVAEGSVAVGRAGRPAVGADALVLAPHERATLTGDAAPELTRGVALDSYLAWTDGRLVFQRAPLPDVARRLERWYGIEIRLADSSLRARRLTATLEEEGAAQAIDLVATSLELTVSRSGNVYVLGRHP